MSIHVIKQTRNEALGLSEYYLMREVLPYMEIGNPLCVYSLQLVHHYASYFVALIYICYRGMFYTRVLGS